MSAPTLSRHAATVAPERLALTLAVRGLRGLLAAPGEHARGCAHRKAGTCSTACAEARAALTGARLVLFPWTATQGQP